MGLLPAKGAGSPSQHSKSGNSLDGAPGKRFQLKRLLFLGALATFILLLGGCTDDLQSTWDPAGPVAQKQLDLFNLVLWVMVAVFILVEGALLYTVFRYRRRPGQGLPHQTHGHQALEITWTIIPTLLIMGVGVWSAIALFDLENPQETEAGDALEVIATGHQWWFEFEYPDAADGKHITTANELKVPVDRPILVKLQSDDVIHSFWLPKLAGKVDMVPTRTNELWFRADSDKVDSLPQTFYGQCAELCGIAHALMKFRVEVLSAEDYLAWVENYGAPPQLSEAAQRGQNVFNGKGGCVVCHTANGSDQPQVVDARMQGFLSGGPIAPGPNLTDLATRGSFAAGLEDLTAENLHAWITDPEEIKPGNYMKERAAVYQTGEVNLTDGEINDLIEYLLSLK